MSGQPRARAYALGAVLLWSTVASAFELSLGQVTPVALLLFSSLVATLTLLAVVIAQGKLHKLARTSARELGRSALLGALNPFGYYLVLLHAYDRLLGQEAQVLNYSWGIVLPLLSIPLLRQRIRPLSLAALLISFAGVYVVASRGELSALDLRDPLGVGLAVGSSLLWALFWIFNLRDPRDEVCKLLLNFAFGFLFALAWAIARGLLVLPSAKGLLGCLYVGLFEMGITFVLWLKAMKHSRTTAQVANLIFLAPFLSLVLLHFVVGEEIHPSSVAGLALIVGGILLQRRTERARSEGRSSSSQNQPSAGSDLRRRV